MSHQGRSFLTRLREKVQALLGSVHTSTNTQFSLSKEAAEEVTVVQLGTSKHQIFPFTPFPICLAFPVQSQQGKNLLKHYCEG